LTHVQQGTRLIKHNPNHLTENSINYNPFIKKIPRHLNQRSHRIACRQALTLLGDIDMHLPNDLAYVHEN